MKNKIAIVTVFAMVGIVFLAGCISININKAPSDNPVSTTNSVAPAGKGGSTTNGPSTTNSMYLDKHIGVARN